MNEMNATTQDKATVYYIGVPKFYNWDGQADQPVARLQYVMNHPRLGDCPDVRTSVVQKVLLMVQSLLATQSTNRWLRRKWDHEV